MAKSKVMTLPTTTTTTTAPEPVPIEAQRNLFATAFEDLRGDLIALLEENPHVDSVDRVEFVPASDEIVLAVTSGYSTEEINADIAWEITRAAAALWEDEGMVSSVDFPVSFSLSVSNMSVSCPNDFMVSLAGHRASRAEWENACQ